MNKVMDYSKNKYKFLLLPVVIIIAGIIMYFVHGGFNFDVEFMGGIRMQVDIGQSFDNDDVSKIVKETTGLGAVVQE